MGDSKSGFDKKAKLDKMAVIQEFNRQQNLKNETNNHFNSFHGHFTSRVFSRN